MLLKFKFIFSAWKVQILDCLVTMKQGKTYSTVSLKNNLYILFLSIKYVACEILHEYKSVFYYFYFYLLNSTLLLNATIYLFLFNKLY